MSNITTEIVIDLSTSRDATSGLGSEGLIQREAFERFKTLLRDIHASIKPFQERLDSPEGLRWPIRTHDVITVDGARGSGKTTFILNACRNLVDKERKTEGGTEAPFDRIEFLGILDPTLVETREHVFLSLISLIKQRVDEWHKDRSSATHERERTYQRWNESLRGLAGGITILDGVGKDPLSGEDWMDAEFIMEHGIKNAHSGKMLERHFHCFVRESLKYLEKDAFLLVFDDIDTDTSNGWTVLEIIRKYLTTPQLMVVLSGDLKLYSLLVENQQWKRLGQEMPESEKPVLEKPGDNRFWPVVRELLDQYLLKILKPSQRIELRELEHYNREPYTLGVRRAGKEPEAPLLEILEEFCRQALHCNATGERDRLVRLLLQRPVRTMVALLNAYALALPDTTKSLAAQTVAPERMLDLYLSLAHVFHLGLVRLGYSVAELERFDSCRSVETLIVNLNRIGVFPNAAGLRPTFQDERLNDAMLCLGGLFAWQMARQPAGYFHYLLKICLTIESFREDPEVWGAGYLGHVNLLGLETPLHVGRSYVSFRYHRPFSGSARPALEQGSMRLRVHGKEGLAGLRDRLYEKNPSRDTYEPTSTWLKPYWKHIDHGKANKDAILGVFYNRMPSLAANIPSWHAHVAQLPYSINLIQGKSNPHFSFFSLFGALGVLLEGGSLEATLPVASQPRMFPAWNPKEEGATPPARDESTPDDAETPAKDEKSAVDPAFLTAWDDWKRLTPLGLRRGQGGVPSTTVLARAWTRFQYTLVDIAEKTPRFDCLAGNIMHRWIVAFLHALLLEEALERHGPELPA